MKSTGRATPIQMSLGLRPSSTADQHVACFHRGSDRRRLRAMLAGIAAAGVVVALVLGLVGLRMQQVRLSYRLDILRTSKAGAEEMNRRLLVEKASLQSLARIEDEARTRLGMVAATYQQPGPASRVVRPVESSSASPPVKWSASMKRGEAAPPP